MRALALAVVVLAAPCFAQASALVVTCGDCGAFQAIQVLLDGQDMATNTSVRVVDISPGGHQVKVVKWVSPFSTEVLYDGVVDFPGGVELRARATKGKLDVFGRGTYAPPAPPPQGPSDAAVQDARDALRDAKDQVAELQDDVADGSDDCVPRLSGRLGALEDALDDGLDRTDASAVGVAQDKAEAARRALGDCGKRRRERWSKTLGRVESRLGKAARALR